MRPVTKDLTMAQKFKPPDRKAKESGGVSQKKLV